MTFPVDLSFGPPPVRVIECADLRAHLSAPKKAGTRILDPGRFFSLARLHVREDLAILPPDHDDVLCGCTISLPSSLNRLVSSGMGRMDGVSREDYLVRDDAQGAKIAYLPRERALGLINVSVDVVPAAAYRGPNTNLVDMTHVITRLYCHVPGLQIRWSSIASVGWIELLNLTSVADE